MKDVKKYEGILNKELKELSRQTIQPYVQELIRFVWDENVEPLREIEDSYKHELLSDYLQQVKEFILDNSSKLASQQVRDESKANMS